MLPLRRGDSYSIILDLPMYDSFKFPLNHNNYSSKSFKSISDYYVKGFYLNIIYVILSSNMISASKQTFNFTEINIYNNSYEASQHIFPGKSLLSSQGYYFYHLSLSNYNQTPIQSSLSSFIASLVRKGIIIIIDDSSLSI